MKTNRYTALALEDAAYQEALDAVYGIAQAAEERYLAKAREQSIHAARLAKYSQDDDEGAALAGWL